MTTSQPLTVSGLQATLEAAAAFGLSDGEIWMIAKRVCDQLPPDTTLGTAVERLTAQLARAILKGTPL